MSLLKVKVLPELLSQAVTNGTVSALLTTVDGSIMAVAGNKSQSGVTAAIAASIWSSYTIALSEDSSVVSTIVVRNEQGTIAITRVAALLLILIGEHDAPEGILRAKLAKLAEYLREPLEKVVPAEETVMVN